MKLIKLTHANLNQPMYIVASLIGGYYFSPGHKCTHVVMSGGAVFPAQESTETIGRLLDGVQSPAQPAEAQAEAVLEGQNG